MKNEQNSADHNRVDSVCVTTVLSQEQFKEFYSFLNIIEPHFNDLCINKGQFRSPSNDRSIIVETAFTYFENLDFFVTDICLLVKMLSTFDKGTDITITTDKYNITVTDGFRSVHVANATLEFFANEFTSDEKINEYIFDNIDREKPIIRETQSKALVQNINKMTLDLDANTISIKHKENDLNRGYLSISKQKESYSTSNKIEYVIEFKKDFLTLLNANKYFSVVSLPFIFNKADMTFNYYLEKDRPVICAIYNTSVDNLFINIYSRSNLIEEDEIV